VSRQPTIIVATQVVEVSLNIDLDTIYTDPAPLEALLQRFGRVNRGRQTQMLCPVYVFRDPLGAKESLPYNDQIVQASIEVLTRYCAGKPIDEALVTQMLAEMYQGEIEAAWQEKFRRHCLEFQQVLDGMIPFTSAAWELEKKFYDLFDGWQVLPLACYDEYEQSIMRYDYLGASQYLVNISANQFGMLSGKGLLRAQEEGQYFRQAAVPYDPEFGLDLNNRLGKDEAP